MASGKTTVGKALAAALGIDFIDSDAMVVAATGLSAADLAAGLVADERGVALWTRGAVLHTDDRPILEFTAARSMGFNRSGPILSGLVEAGRAAGPLALGSSGEMR
ncbi:MAG: hypothetical protein EHM57_06195 [Actinobacteria bacterium]|nr:MAG: hypothetical protein EHM57_06195 [Actinomycetota bacterium]